MSKKALPPSFMKKKGFGMKKKADNPAEEGAEKAMDAKGGKKMPPWMMSKGGKVQTKGC